MKTRINFCLAFFVLFSTVNALCQGFVETIEDESFNALFNNACILTPKSGEPLTGKLAGGAYVNNGLSKVTIKLENGEKVKFAAEQIMSLHIQSSGMLKIMMISESAHSIMETAKTDFNDIVNREWIIFETALIPKKADTYRLMQLLNPGFDSKIKVFAEPGKKTGGLSVGGLNITGGEDRAFLFVKGGAKAFEVKKNGYAKNFEELYSDCPKMIETIKGDKIKWDDVAGHVLVYDRVCK